MNIKIIGTSHIARQSVDEIKKVVAEYAPEIIAVELDAGRAAALMEEKQRKTSLRQIGMVGLNGYLFAKIGQYIQQKLGKMVGISPGSEMGAALELARKNKLEVALIDQPIQVTLRKFSKELTWREKGRFIQDLLLGLIMPRRQIRQLGLANFDLRKVPHEDLILAMMEAVKKRYPSVYKTLVEDRNKYMVRKLVQIVRLDKEKKILVVVGAGHKKGMEELLLKVDVL